MGASGVGEGPVQGGGLDKVSDKLHVPSLGEEGLSRVPENLSPTGKSVARRASHAEIPLLKDKPIPPQCLFDIADHHPTVFKASQREPQAPVQPEKTAVGDLNFGPESEAYQQYEPGIDAPEQPQAQEAPPTSVASLDFGSESLAYEQLEPGAGAPEELPQSPEPERAKPDAPQSAVDELRFEDESFALAAHGEQPMEKDASVLADKDKSLAEQEQGLPAGGHPVAQAQSRAIEIASVVNRVLPPVAHKPPEGYLGGLVHPGGVSAQITVKENESHVAPVKSNSALMKQLEAAKKLGLNIDRLKEENEHALVQEVIANPEHFAGIESHNGKMVVKEGQQALFDLSGRPPAHLKDVIFHNRANGLVVIHQKHLNEDTLRYLVSLKPSRVVVINDSAFDHFAAQLTLGIARLIQQTKLKEKETEKHATGTSAPKAALKQKEASTDKTSESEKREKVAEQVNAGDFEKSAAQRNLAAVRAHAKEKKAKEEEAFEEYIKDTDIKRGEKKFRERQDDIQHKRDLDDQIKGG